MRVRMSMRKKLLYLPAILVSSLTGLQSCYPPPPEYTATPLITERRTLLRDNLLLMLPEEWRNKADAKAEAQWIADTAYKAAAGIARQYDSNFPGWAGNYFVNSRLQERGLCWHYQHDMYRELRRRPLTYFGIGCCVRDEGERSEHNCVYVHPITSEWPHAWVLDGWPWNGRLQVFNAWELDPDRWGDRESVTNMLSDVYTEGHTYPMEHWLHIRSKRKWYELSMFGMPTTYMDSWWPGSWNAPQHQKMLYNIAKGKKSHPNSPTNY